MDSVQGFSWIVLAEPVKGAIKGTQSKVKEYWLLVYMLKFGAGQVPDFAGSCAPPLRYLMAMRYSTSHICQLVPVSKPLPAWRQRQVSIRCTSQGVLPACDGTQATPFGSETFKIVGGKRLNGTIPVSGSKNSSLTIIVAALLTKETSQIHNVPDITDVHTMLLLLTALGVETHYRPTCEYCGTVTINPEQISHTPPEELVKRIRASILLAGPLLARCGKVSIAAPGGCAIGNKERPVNLHMQILSTMGAKIVELGNRYEMNTEDGLSGAHVNLSYPSVGATCTFLLSAASAQGVSKLKNAACEPEVFDLGCALIHMGAKIEGLGTRCITVSPAERFKGLDWTVIPDRIEAGTYLQAAAITGSCLTVTPCVTRHMQPVYDMLEEVGCKLTKTPIDAYGQCSITVLRRSRPLQGVSVLAAPFPGFPTDMLPQTTALLATCQGTSMIQDGVFDSRMKGHLGMISEFAGSTAKILQLSSNTAWMEDTASMSGSKKRRLVADNVSGPLVASDLRAGAALVLCALAADGESTIHNVTQISRGYSKCWQKLANVGASISFEVGGEQVFTSGDLAQLVE